MTVFVAAVVVVAWFVGAGWVLSAAERGGARITLRRFGLIVLGWPVLAVAGVAGYLREQRR